MASTSLPDLTSVPASLSDPSPHRLSVAWRESAACRREDPELFFPIGSGGAAAADIQRAKAICAGCPVQRPCLAYAMITRQGYGIWGGCDEDDRRLLYRKWRETRIDADEERPASAKSG